ncbi:hypothetical protein [Natronomonas marina]|uniref:hypothetical protein n=1 Tax=Natronomonas marina TaxID=2961939 RepID=UPI0020C95461|nr:hypothetical protein [Natronomonas marina]
MAPPQIYLRIVLKRNYMMRRRRLLQTISVGLTAGTAGCNRLESDTTTPTETPSPTATDTATPTVTESREYAPEDLTIPNYMELLPQKHLRGEQRTNNSNFVRIDWEWYIRMINAEMTFGATKTEDWTLAPDKGNLFRPPKYDLIHTPLGATIDIAEIITDPIGEGFPNVGPELLKQTGLAAESEQQESAREVDEVIGYSSPGIIMFVGANLSSFHEAVADNPSTKDDRYPDTVVYSGVEHASSRNIIVSEARDRDIIAVESGDEDPEALHPLILRLAGEGESVVGEESVQWCLSKLRPGMPMVVGEIRDGRVQFDDSPYSNREVQRLPEFDAIFYGFDTNGETGMGQAVTSRIKGSPPSEAELREVYGSPDGQVTTSANDNVSEITVTWGPQQLSRPVKALSDNQL